MADQPSTVSTPAVPAPSLAPPPPPGPFPEQKVAMPLHVQKLQGALCLDKLIDQVEQAFNDSLSLRKDSIGYSAHYIEIHTVLLYLSPMGIRKHSDGFKGIPHLDQLKGPRVYNFTHVTEERQWVKVSHLESLSW